MDEKKRPSPRSNPVATGLAVSAVSAAFLLAARYRTADGAAAAWFIPLFAFAAGGLAALFQARKLNALLAGTVFGIVNGIVSSLGMLGQPVEDVFFIVAATMTFFMALCLTVGAFVEFVFFLHHVAHGRDPREYGRQPAKK